MNIMNLIMNKKGCINKIENVITTCKMIKVGHCGYDIYVGEASAILWINKKTKYTSSI